MVKITDNRQSATRRIPVEGIDLLALLGANDQNLRLLETMFDCEVFLRGTELVLVGEESAVLDLEQVILRMVSMVQTGGTPQARQIGELARGVREGTLVKDDDEESMEGKKIGVRESRVVLTGLRKVIKARGPGQLSYLRMIMENDIVIAIGPAGTGKTYLAVAAAIDALNKKRVKRIILARPAVEAGEQLGFLPGDMQEKVDPYLRPLYDALNDMLAPDTLGRYLENGTIEIAPLAYMRGRTLQEAFVILDEAQNASQMQIKMFLTRLGVNSRAVITGDKTQIDLPGPELSGLLQAEKILRGVEGIAFAYFSEADVVRHRLVQRIIRAYDQAQEIPGLKNEKHS
ncbi:MAG: PhoH family protein [Gemmatimonadota bacterium]|nr:PhoH family protein [Gemmatimonadota bacterium]